MEEKIILVDENDKETGIEEKIKAHQDGGKLHRAISILIFSPEGKILLQRRAGTKYHCPGLWSNTCCSHPRPGERTIDAAHRRLKEEMGFDCRLKKVFDFIYKVDFDNNLSEWEFDHFFTGQFKGEPDPNSEEVGEWKWINWQNLEKDVEKNPQNYTYWFRYVLKNFEKVLKSESFSSFK